MTNTYELSTFKDIFDNIPSDRVKDCLGEIADIIIQAQNMRNVFLTCAESLGAELDEYTTKSAMEFPQTFVWTDDGKGDLEFTIKNGEETLLKYHYKKEE